MTFVELTKHCAKLIEKHPDKKSEIVELWQLAHTEIEEGGSEFHECELAMSDIEELIKE
jgi:hypothetical protein